MACRSGETSAGRPAATGMSTQAIKLEEGGELEVEVEEEEVEVEEEEVEESKEEEEEDSSACMLFIKHKSCCRCFHLLMQQKGRSKFKARQQWST